MFNCRVPLAAAVILILTILLWDTVLAGHHHIEAKPELCEICLLPQIADVVRINLDFQPATSITTHFAELVCNPLLQIIAVYFGRGPPA